VGKIIVKKKETANSISGIIHQSGFNKTMFELDEETLAVAKNVSQTALLVIGAAGVLLLAAVAPNIFKAIENIEKISGQFSGKSSKKKNEKFLQSVYYLRHSGKIKFKKTGDELLVSLTEKGKNSLSALLRKKIPLPKKEKWNKKWWLVAADIPTKKHKADADKFRKKLKELKFYPLQRTLWLYPFNPVETVLFLAQCYGIQHYVTVMEINRLDREDLSKVKNYFKESSIL